MGQHLATLARLRDKAEQMGKFSDAISAEVSRGRALTYCIERGESGASGTADCILEETIAKIAAKQAIHSRGAIGYGPG